MVSTHLVKEELEMLEPYFQSVDFDFSVTGKSQGRLAACQGFRLLRDTGFAEMIAVAWDHTVPELLTPCLGAAIKELRSRNALFLGTSPLPDEGAFRMMMDMGFEGVSEQLLLSKSIFVEH